MNSAEAVAEGIGERALDYAHERDPLAKGPDELDVDRVIYEAVVNSHLSPPQQDVFEGWIRTFARAPLRRSSSLVRRAVEQEQQGLRAGGLPLTPTRFRQPGYGTAPAEGVYAAPTTGEKYGPPAPRRAAARQTNVAMPQPSPGPLYQAKTEEGPSAWERGQQAMSRFWRHLTAIKPPWSGTTTPAGRFG